jgi:hypothetical protein
MKIFDRHRIRGGIRDDRSIGLDLDRLYGRMRSQVSDANPLHHTCAAHHIVQYSKQENGHQWQHERKEDDGLASLCASAPPPKGCPSSFASFRHFHPAFQSSLLETKLIEFQPPPFSCSRPLNRTGANHETVHLPVFPGPLGA